MACASVPRPRGLSTRWPSRRPPRACPLPRLHAGGWSVLVLGARPATSASPTPGRGPRARSAPRRRSGALVPPHVRLHDAPRRPFPSSDVTPPRHPGLQPPSLRPSSASCPSAGLACPARPASPSWLAPHLVYRAAAKWSLPDLLSALRVLSSAPPCRPALWESSSARGCSSSAACLNRQRSAFTVSAALPWLALGSES